MMPDILGYLAAGLIILYGFAIVMVGIGFMTRDAFWFGITRKNRRPWT